MVTTVFIKGYMAKSATTGEPFDWGKFGQDALSWAGKNQEKLIGAGVGAAGGMAVNSMLNPEGGLGSYVGAGLLGGGAGYLGGGVWKASQKAKADKELLASQQANVDTLPARGAGPFSAYIYGDTPDALESTAAIHAQIDRNAEALIPEIRRLEAKPNKTPDEVKRLARFIAQVEDVELAKARATQGMADAVKNSHKDAPGFWGAWADDRYSPVKRANTWVVNNAVHPVWNFVTGQDSPSVLENKARVARGEAPLPIPRRYNSTLPPDQLRSWLNP